MSAVLWTVETMAKVMNGRLVGNHRAGVSGLSIDTRSLIEGEAYFAIKGDIHDGHKFVANAHSAGAALSVVSEDWLNRLDGETGPLLIVDDVLEALVRLAVASRARSKARIVAITGSVGKTTTKEALRTALAACGKVHAAVASFNNHWGVPLTLARMPEGTDFGVIEIGMNHPDEITPLVKMARPHVAVINNVAAVHLGAFKDVDAIAHAKAEIFDGLEPNGTAVLNADDERLPLLTELARQKGIKNIVRFGESAEAEARIENLVMHGSCSCLTAKILGDDMVVKVGAPGRHIVQNVVAVLACCKLVGADLARAALALADMKPVKGRGQRHKIRVGSASITLIDESYNANPTSVRAALALLAASVPKTRGRHVAVLGDMLELGPTSSQLHLGLADAIVENNIERIFLVGPEMKALESALSGKAEVTHVSSVDDLIPLVKADLRDGDILMAKASLGMRFALLIDDLLNTGSAES